MTGQNAIKDEVSAISYAIELINNLYPEKHS
jgi:hypothetical protein